MKCCVECLMLNASNPHDVSVVVVTLLWTREVWHREGKWLPWVVQLGGMDLLSYSGWHRVHALLLSCIFSIGWARGNWNCWPYPGLPALLRCALW